MSVGILLTIAAGSDYEITVHDVRHDRSWSPRTGPNRVGRPPMLILHHTVTHTYAERVDEQYQHLVTIQQSGPYGLPYNFVLFDGEEPRYWYCNDVDEPHPHTYRYNQCVALGVVGNYEVRQPSDQLVDRIVRWLGAMRVLWNSYSLPFVGHKDVYPTACPGRHLYWITQEF